MIVAVVAALLDHLADRSVAGQDDFLVTDRDLDWALVADIRLGQFDKDHLMVVQAFQPAVVMKNYK